MLNLSASAISKAIREKKKQRANEMPDVVDRSPMPEMNAQDVWDTEKRGYIEDMVDSPKKISADETMMDEPSDDAIMASDKARMGRLKMYFDKLDL